MIKLFTIIGARPQFIKAAALSRAIRNYFSAHIKEVIVHTGQHYDENMSQIFFKEMGIPKEDYNLKVGSGLHGKQTAAMIDGIEEVLLKEKPVCAVLYGDTNSTLAGAIAAVKLHIPVVHIEAGLRSFNKNMPEEINRLVCDHCSTLLFSPTKKGYINLLMEGFSEHNNPPYSAGNPKVYYCGDVMYDNALYFSGIAEKRTDLLRQYHLEKNNFILLTLHRDFNTDNFSRLHSILHALNAISTEHHLKIIFPVHPRTAKSMQTEEMKTTYHTLCSNPNFILLPPVSFLEMMALEKNCLLVCTDSGGVQKESFFFKKPCIILRPETEWTELIECGTAMIADADEKKIMQVFLEFSQSAKLSFPPIFGDGHTAEFICEELIKNF